MLDVGATITVTTTLDGGAHTRFVGAVTDISQGWDEAGDDTPDMAVGQVVRHQQDGRSGQAHVVGDEPWAQQLDGERVCSPSSRRLGWS